jgi:DNA-binding transcriptional regulator GbsR (MarR family)
VLKTLYQRGPLSLDELTEHTGASISALSAAVVMLELKARLVKHTDGRYECR